MKNEIKIVEDYFYDVVLLWQEAFKDSREDIEFFLNNCKHKQLLCYFCEGKLASMLFLVDCKVNSVFSKYIYAACTFECYKKMGFMTKLLEYSKNEFDNIVLVPADNSLIEFYKMRGFDKINDIKSISFDETDSIKEYLLEGCSLENPFLLCYKGD